jgi:SNF2 family DNA or RNA helicase
MVKGGDTMIFVHQYDDNHFAVQFKPIQENLKRIRTIPSAKFDGDKLWTIHLNFLAEFENLFKGEFIYITPRHIMTGDPAPPLPGMYKKIPKHEVTRIKPPYKLYDYQKFGANFLACIAGGTGHAFLTDRVGVGKTPQAIAAAHIMQDQGKVDTVIVFCKASLKYQWLRDGIQKFTDDDGIVIDGTKKQRQKLYEEAKDSKYRYVFVNYELLLHDFDLLQDIVKAKNIKLACCDESHKVVNPKGKMNNALAKLVQSNKKTKYPGIDYVFYLTATPLSSKIEQMYGLFSIKRPDYFGKFSEFSKKYLKYSYNGRTSELVGYKNIDDIREKTWKFMLRRTDKEIDMELPEMVEIFKDVSLTPLQRQLDALAQQELEQITNQLSGIDRSKAPPEQIEALEGVAKSMFYVRKAICDDPQLLLRSQSTNIQKKFGSIIENHKDKNKSPKWDELKDLIEEMVIEGGEKLIIFSELETMLQLLRERIEKMGIEYVLYTGKMNSTQKDTSAQEFKNNPNCKIFLGSDAAAEGLNLQFCPYIINYDLPWNPDILTQRNGRIQRGGSTYKTVKVINLMANEGIDSAVWEAIQNKQNLFNYFVENTEEQSQALKEAMKE